jgi:nucleotide-binding universal stress UspA family protein
MNTEDNLENFERNPENLPRSGSAPARPQAQEVLAPDDAARREAIDHLLGQLNVSGALIERCELLAHTSKGDRTKPLFAGARLLAANAQLARALALLAQTEIRHRSIVETIQHSGQGRGRLNYSFSNDPSSYEVGPTPEYQRQEQARERLTRKLDRLLEQHKEEEAAQAAKLALVQGRDGDGV